MRGKWAAGIEPRELHLGVQGILAVSERPGGSTTVHRRVRRDEELLWLKHQGFGRVISILPVMQNLSAYFEHGLTASHYALRGGPQQREVLEACYQRPRATAMANKTMVLLHGDEVSDRLLGVIAGYLVWSQTRRRRCPASIALRRAALQALDRSRRAHASAASTCPRSDGRERRHRDCASFACSAVVGVLAEERDARPAARLRHRPRAPLRGGGAQRRPRRDDELRRRARPRRRASRPRGATCCSRRWRTASPARSWPSTRGSSR